MSGQLNNISIRKKIEKENIELWTLVMRCLRANSEKYQKPRAW